MTQPSVPNEGTPQTKKPLSKTKKVLIGIGGAFAFLIWISACGAILGGDDSTTPAEPTPTVTATVTSAPAPAPAETSQAPVAKKTTTAPAPKPPPKPKPQPAKNVTSREYAKILKNPDNYIGDRIIVYGQVNQFDSATGDDTFLASTAHRNTMEYGYFDGENTMLTGPAGRLDDLVEDDVFKASVTVLGSQDYDTQIGGNTSVLLLEVNSIKVIS